MSGIFSHEWMQSLVCLYQPALVRHDLSTLDVELSHDTYSALKIASLFANTVNRGRLELLLATDTPSLKCRPQMKNNQRSMCCVRAGFYSWYLPIISIMFRIAHESFESAVCETKKESQNGVHKQSAIIDTKGCSVTVTSCLILGSYGKPERKGESEERRKVTYRLCI